MGGYHGPPNESKPPLDKPAAPLTIIWERAKAGAHRISIRSPGRKFRARLPAKGGALSAQAFVPFIPSPPPSRGEGAVRATGTTLAGSVQEGRARRPAAADGRPAPAAGTFPRFQYRGRRPWSGGGGCSTNLRIEVASAATPNGSGRLRPACRASIPGPRGQKRAGRITTPPHESNQQDRIRESVRAVAPGNHRAPRHRACSPVKPAHQRGIACLRDPALHPSGSGEDGGGPTRHLFLETRQSPGPPPSPPTRRIVSATVPASHGNRHTHRTSDPLIRWIAAFVGGVIRDPRRFAWRAQRTRNPTPSKRRRHIQGKPRNPWSVSVAAGGPRGGNHGRPHRPVIPGGT